MLEIKDLDVKVKNEDKVILNKSSDSLEKWKDVVLSNYKESSEKVKLVLEL